MNLDHETTFLTLGLCVLYRDQLRVQQLEVPTSGSILESLWIGLRRGQSSVLGVMYRPPRGAVLPVLDDMQSQLAHVLGFNKPLLLVGDFNFDTAQPGKPGVQAYMEQLEDLNLKQLLCFVCLFIEVLGRVDC